MGKRKGCLLHPRNFGILTWLIIVFLVVSIPTRLAFGKWFWEQGFVDGAKARFGLGPKPAVAVSPTIPTKPITVVTIKPTDTPKPKPTETPKPAVVTVSTNTPVPVATNTSAPPKPVSPTPKVLPVVEVGLVVYAPYASFVGAVLFGEQWGVQIKIVNLTGLEAEQCNWVKGIYDPPKPEVVVRLLTTTHNSARACEGVEIPFAIDRSAGTDAIVVKTEIKSWNQIFTNKIIGTGYCSVSEYLIKSFAWALGEKIPNWVPADDAEPALNEFVSDPTIKSAVLWEPYVSDALAQVKGSWVALSTKNWSGIWDVVVTPSHPDFNENIFRALAAYCQFLKLEMENQNLAWEILAKWAAENPESGALGYDKAEDFYGDLAGVAQATLKDNIRLFLVDPQVMELRLQEVEQVMAEYPCLDDEGRPVSLPRLQGPMLDQRYVRRLRDERLLETNAQPVNTDISIVRAAPLEKEFSSELARVIGQTEDVFIEYVEDLTDFKDSKDAEQKIEKTYVRVLRLSNNTIMDLIGGYAMPAGCMEKAPGGGYRPCTDEAGRLLAIQRAEKVRKILVEEYKIPENRVRLAQNEKGEIIIRQPANRGTRDVNLMSQDRRVQGRVLFIAGQ